MDKYVCWSVSSSGLDWCNSSTPKKYDCAWEHVEKYAEREMIDVFNNEVARLKSLPYDSIVVLKKSYYLRSIGMGISSFPDSVEVVMKVGI